MSYFYQPNGSSTKFNLTNIMSTSNPITSATLSSGYSANFKSFPNKTNVAINNSNFDKAVGNIRYKMNGTDIGNDLPAKVDYYGPTRVRNTYTIPAVTSQGIGGISDPSGCKLNDTSNQTITIENCFNYISVILCGGGGGGGPAGGLGGAGAISGSTPAGSNGGLGCGGGGGGSGSTAGTAIGGRGGDGYCIIKFLK